MESSSNTHFVYVLELEENYFYVGMAPDVEARYEKHIQGNGADWTRIHKPIRIMQKREFASWTDAAINEDAATLWLMAKHNKGIVRGGRWLSEGHHTIYGYTEAIHVMRNPNLSREQQYQRILDIAVWTIPDSWYWRGIIERSPNIKKRLKRHPSFGRIPSWLKIEREAGTAKYPRP